MSTSKPTIEATFEGHTEEVESVCFSPDSSKVCSVSGDKSVFIWSKKILREFLGHTDEIYDAQFSPLGRFVASASGDKTVRLWNTDIEEGDVVVLEGHRDEVTCVNFAHRSKNLFSGSEDNVMKIWDLEKKSALTLFTRAMKTDWEKSAITCINTTRDDRTIIIGFYDGNVRFFDARNPKDSKCIRTLNDHSGKCVFSVELSKDDKYFATCGSDKKIHLYENACGENDFKRIHTFEEHTKVVGQIHFHPDGRHLVSGSTGERIKYFDILEKKCLLDVEEEVFASSVQFSPDGKFLVSGGKKVVLWKSGIGD